MAVRKCVPSKINENIFPCNCFSRSLVEAFFGEHQNEYDPSNELINWWVRVMRSANDLPHAWVDVTQNALASAGKSSPQSGPNQYQFGLINIFLMLCQVRRDFAGWLCKISPSIIIKIFAQRSTQKTYWMAVLHKVLILIIKTTSHQSDPIRLFAVQRCQTHTRLIPVERQNLVHKRPFKD